MTNKIIYVEPNYNLAADFKGKFNEKDYNLLIVKLGEEALDILKREDKVLLLLVNTIGLNADVCELLDFVESYKKEDIIRLVIVDENDVNTIVKLANTYNVEGMIISPFDTNEVIKTVISKLENINPPSDENEKQNEGNDTPEIEGTLKNLTEILKKQQHGYSKLDTVFKYFSDVLDEEAKSLPDSENKGIFAREAFETMLKMQTTGSFDIDSLAELIRGDLLDFHKIKNGVKVGKVESCLFGGISKTTAENIRFAIWLVARYYIKFYDDLSIDVTSKFLAPTTAEFLCHVELDEKYSLEEIEKNSDGRSLYREFVLGVIGRLFQDVRREGTDKNIELMFSVPVKD